MNTECTQTHWEYTVDDHVGVVLAVCHQLVHSLDAVPEVLGSQQT